MDVPPRDRPRSAHGDNQEVDMSITTSAREALAAFRGALFEPQDAGYDEARAVYNAMIDRRPGLVARAAGADDVARVIAYASESACRSPSAAAATTAPGWARSTTGSSSTSARSAASTSIRSHAPSASAAAAPGARWTVPPTEHGLATPSGIIGDDRRRRAHAGRRPRAPDPSLRPRDRQPDLRRGRPRQRRAGRREPRRAPGPVLGAARRRRQLRRGHGVRVPAPRGAHHRRRADVLAGRAGRRGALGVPRVPPRPRAS